MIAAPEKSFVYRIPWKSGSTHLGDHRGAQRGLGFEYRGNVSLIDYPDARRMDISRSLRDPLEQIQVRLFNQESTTPVYIACDMSSSMQFQGGQRKLDQALEMAASIGLAARNAGDVFGFVGYNDQLLDETLLPLSHRFHELMEHLQHVRGYTSMHLGSEGILQIPLLLGQQRSLVFWLSDFHMPLNQVELALQAMSGHQVIPLVIWDDHEFKRMPKFGFGNMIDPETGATRTLFFRKALRERIAAVYADRRQALQHLFLKFDSPALFINGDYHPDLMTRYFEQYMNL